MRVFGITGGSGSGKTTFSELLAERGVEIIDTDVIAREVVAVGNPCLAELARGFGSSILLPDGGLDRKKLADLAFSSPEKTELLNSITHKYIKQAVEERINMSHSELVGIDGAVIIGSEIEPLCEFIVSVLADFDVRISRIMRRDGLTREQAKTRLAAQPNDLFYKENSLYIIYNNGGADELAEQADNLLSCIKE